MLSLLALGAIALGTPAFDDAPRLTVVISIDQFRADYLTRFDSYYLPATTKGGVGGFKWLMQKGAYYVNAEYDHVPTETGPGHAIIGTGSSPAMTGIVGNEWFSRTANAQIYCVADSDAKDVTTGASSYSAKNLQVSTFGDELKRATNGMARQVSIALKDRAAILMGGRLADDVIWFNSANGQWTTSSSYSKTLSAWVTSINGKKIPDESRGKQWAMTLPSSSYALTSVPDKPSVPSSFGKAFPHSLPADDPAYFVNWMRTPMANAFVFETAKAAVAARDMGKDEIPDVLTINLSTNDYVGHWFGPDSPEVLDISVNTDRQLSDFFQYLDKTIPGGLKNVLIVVTADHGVLPMAEELTKRGLPGGRVNFAELAAKVKAAVDKEFEVTNSIKFMSEYMIYLDPAVLEDQDEFDDAEMFLRDYLRKMPEVYTAFTRWELEEQQLPPSDVARKLGRSYNRQNSGDVFFFLKPGYVLDFTGTGTSHGSPWSYDSQVPLLFAGRWVAPGRHPEKCGPEDIAATVCKAMGIVPPSGNVGHALGVH